MRFVFEPAPATPLVSFSVVARGGSSMDPAGLEGIGRHAVELCKRGAGGRSREQIDDTLDSLGASLDAGASRDSLSLTGLCLERHLDALLDLAVDVLANPHLAEEEHQKLIRETMADVADARNDDGVLANRFWARHVIPGHPYGRTVWGTEATLQAIAAQRPLVAKTLQSAFCRSNLIIGVTGAIDLESAQGIAERLFSALPEGQPAALPSLDRLPQQGRRLLLVDKPERRQSQVIIGHDAPAYGDPDFPGLLAAQTAFGGMFSSPFVEQMRVQRGWSYNVNAHIARGRGPLWFAAEFAPSTDTTRDALQLATEMITAFSASGPTAEQLAHTQRYLTGHLPFSRATPRQRMRQAVILHLYDLPTDYPDDVIRRVQALNRSDVSEVASRVFRPDDLATVVVCTAGELRAALEGAGFGSMSVEMWDSY